MIWRFENLMIWKLFDLKSERVEYSKRRFLAKELKPFN